MTCLIFDLDGTLIDSETLGNQAFLDLLPDLDDTIDGLLLRYRGRRMKEVLDDLATRLGRPLGEDFARRHLDHLASLYESCLAPMPGVLEALAMLSYPKCVASNAPPSKMRQALRITGLEGFFGDNVFSAYDVGRWKPDPGVFLHAAERMGYAPEDCVVLEDSEPGIAAGVAAGMRVVRYAPEASAERDDRPVATLTHFRELEALLRKNV